MHVLDPTDDVRALYAAADVFMSPSRAEGTPYSVMEALSSGTPVVASDIPGHAAMGAGIASCPITPHDAGANRRRREELIDREPHEVSADALAAHLWMREKLHLPKWSAGLLDRYEHALAPDRRRLRRARAGAGLAARGEELGHAAALGLQRVAAHALDP